jgi:hypothetical protein
MEPSLPPAELAPAGTPSAPRRFAARVVAYFHRHPILALFLLTPGIPEYLSSSSSLNGLFVAPPLFLLFLAINAGMYLPGALLVREAMVRWRKGWASVICLGGAYAIVEEGIGLNTMFNAHASVVGVLGSYGHWLGVNWVWIPSVMAVHIVFSISLPILLLHMALPEYRGRSLLGGRGIGAALAVLTVDIALLMIAFNFLGLHFFMGVPVLVGALLAIAGLVGLAYVLPPELLRPMGGPPTGRTPWALAVVGAFVLGGPILFESVAGGLGAPAAFTALGIVAILAALLLLARAICPRERPERYLLAFAAGALLPVELLGWFGSFPTTLLATAAISYLLWRLWHRAGTGLPTISPPAPSRAAVAPPLS